MASFHVDEDKLRSAMPRETSTSGEDLGNVLFLIAGPVVLVVTVVLLLASLL